MIRQRKVARDTAVNARTAAMNTLKQISVNAAVRGARTPPRPHHPDHETHGDQVHSLQTPMAAR